MRTAVVALGLAVSAGLLLLLAGCSSCEEDLDCVIVCDCDGDGSDDAFFAHDCNHGFCGHGYDQDVRDGCEALCDERND